MSWLFLIASLVGLWSTYNTFRPMYAPSAASGVSFFAGWLTSELALHHVALQVVVVAALWYFGAIAGWGWQGQAGVVVCLVSWALLFVCFQRATLAADAFTTALDKGLGPDFRERIDARLRPSLRPALDAARMIFPFPVRHEKVVRHRDIVYHSDGKLRLKLDVFRRSDLPKDAPTLLYVHGGAWVLGDKNHQGLPLLHHFAAQGYSCFSIDYRLSPRATFPDHLVDVKRAIAFIRAHGGEHGADPRFLIIAGGSAGGHLAALAALTPNDPEYQVGFESADTSVSACIGLYGVYDFANRHGAFKNNGLLNIVERHILKQRLADAPEAYDKASPVARIHAGAPPFLVVHGELDTLVPIESARHFHALFQSIAKSPIVFCEVPGAQHAFEIFPSLRTKYFLEAAAEFSASVYSAYLEKSAGESASAAVRDAAE